MKNINNKKILKQKEAFELLKENIEGIYQKELSFKMEDISMEEVINFLKSLGGVPTSNNEIISNVIAAKLYRGINEYIGYNCMKIHFNNKRVIIVGVNILENNLLIKLN